VSHNVYEDSKPTVAHKAYHNIGFQDSKPTAAHKAYHNIGFQDSKPTVAHKAYHNIGFHDPVPFHPQKYQCFKKSEGSTTNSRSMVQP